VRHLGGAEFAHVASQLVMFETGKTLHLHRRVIGKPAGSGATTARARAS
jgi:hypothetical protein